MILFQLWYTTELNLHFQNFIAIQRICPNIKQHNLFFLRYYILNKHINNFVTEVKQIRYNYFSGNKYKLVSEYTKYNKNGSFIHNSLYELLATLQALISIQSDSDLNIFLMVTHAKDHCFPVYIKKYVWCEWMEISIYIY